MKELACRSCGKVRRFQPSKLLESPKKFCKECFFYGGTKSPLYRVWGGIKQRCYYKNNQNYLRYGGRGIRVCRAWINDFRAFERWALSNGYEKGLSIERINNNRDYGPSNCTWIPTIKQARNRRSNKLNETKVAKIRQLYTTGRYTQKQLGAMYKVSGQMIHVIVHNKKWII